jgi:hypothetical protein
MMLALGPVVSQPQTSGIRSSRTSSDRGRRWCSLQPVAQGSSGTISVSGDIITVRIDRRAYSPILHQATFPADTAIPWWHGRRLHFEFS